MTTAISTPEYFSNLKYLPGFYNEQQSEDPNFVGALPKEQNNPQQCKYGLYCEQLSGTAFSAPRAENMRSWLYRKLPSVSQCHFQACHDLAFCNETNSICDIHNCPTRWRPFYRAKEYDKGMNFVKSLRRIACAGNVEQKVGLAIHFFKATLSMKNMAFCNADGDTLLIPFQGTMKIVTEFGKLTAESHEVLIIPCGIRWSVFVDETVNETLMGYMVEVWGSHWKIPDLGLIGANGLASSRHFLTPVANVFELEKPNKFIIYQKYQGKMFKSVRDYTCFDVAAWHGNYSPYKYNLDCFCPINSVSFDHMDPSIFTVLTCPSLKPGTALVDFVIFPPRWSVAENTFRPPYYHRNCMSEFMGLISGCYEAKKEGFKVGGATLHSIMIPHGPDKDCFESATSATLAPEKIGCDSLAFMIESSLHINATRWAIEDSGCLDESYCDCWDGLRLGGV